MELTINNVEKGDGAKPNGEYVLLEVLEDTNLNRYVIGDNTYDDEGDISNKLPNTYRFADQEVKKGEFVVLYTGKGNYSFGSLKSGKPLHKLYWGLNKCVWNNAGDTAHLLKIVSTKNTKVS